ncbi:MAG TPA: hypothetical protein VK395_14355 [Gemmataceae bacterium]|nr:hypothetical protein [Gemmataceae bacterium]
MAIARKPLMILGLAVGFFLAGALAEKAATKDVPTVQKLADARVTAARKAYEETALLYREARTRDVDRIYLWSRRWLDAQRDAAKGKADEEAAYAGHWNRMKAVEDSVKNRLRSGAAAAIEVPAVEFYRLEAEIWLSQARAK